MRPEHKALKLELKDITEDGSFKGYASTRKKDLFGDVIAEGAFRHTINMTEGKVPLLWFHGPRDPIGMTTQLTEDGHGLYMEGQLDLDIEPGRRVRSGMQKGYIDRMSIGFRAVKDEIDEQEDTRVIREVELLEISPVTRHFAANDAALVTDVKTADISSLVEELRAFTAVLRGDDPPDGSRAEPDPPESADDPDVASLRARIDEIRAMHVQNQQQEAN